MRLKIIRLIISALFLLVTAKLIHTQVIVGQDYYRQSLSNSIRVVSIEGKRGRIFDRNGTVLVDNRVTFDVVVVPQDIRDKEALFGYLSKILSREKEKLQKTFRQKTISPFAPVVLAKNVSRETAIKIEENKFRFPGLFVQENIRRYYPFGETSAHLLGYVGKISRSRLTQLKEYGYAIKDTVGYSGVEEHYDQFLRGEDGGLQIEVNNQGKQVRVLGFRDSTKGRDITLTVDSRVQQMGVQSLEGRRGAVVVMDSETGEILGMTSVPSFDPNLFVEGSPELSQFFTDSAAPLLNRAISGQYPPGSTLKITNAIAALEEKKINPDTSFFCPGYYLLGKRQFRCSHEHGTQNLIEGIAHSCNVYFFNVGLMIGPQMINKYARLFGLGEVTNIDLPSEAKGLISDKPRRQRDQRWYKGDILNISIGQGDVLVTPIQLIRMMTAVIRGGEFIHPHVLRAVGQDNAEQPSERQHAQVSEETLEILKKGLRGAVEDPAGTARILNIEGLPVLGKTGTAQSSGDKDHHAWFVGYCPSAKTKIVFCVFLEHGGSSYNACAVARNLLLQMKQEEIL